MLWKRKILILLSWIAVSVTTFVTVYRLPSVYKADTLILVDSQKIPEKYVTSTVSTELQDRLMTINQQILSSTRLQKIIDDFGLYAQEKKTLVQEEILEKVRTDISLNLEASGTGNRPGAFRIGYEGTNPTLVAQVANRIANLYIEENLKTREVQAEGTSEFIENQLKEAKKTLDELEVTLSKYKLAHNGNLPEQQGALSAAVAGLQVELQGNQDAINRAQQNKVLLQGTVDVAEAGAGSSPNRERPADSSEASANDNPLPRKDSEFLQAQYNALLKTYLPTYPKMVALQHQIDKVKMADDRDSARIENLRKEILLADDEIRRRNTERERILKSIAQYQARIEQLPVREQEMAQLTRDYEMSKQNYKSLLDKKLSAEMASDMEHRQKSERFTVLDPARVPEKPIKPKRGILNMMGCSIGLALGLLLGVGWEFKQNLFLGEWELPPSAVVLARLPHIEIFAEEAMPKDNGQQPRRKLRLALWSSAAVSLIVVVATGIYLVWNRF
jgi:polysaccharide chain length determinant protein (PEP-CTERM system associated)